MESSHHICKKHESLSKNYKSSKKLNGKIPFKCKKSIWLNKDVSKSSNRTLKETDSSELSRTLLVISKKISSKEIDSELSHTVPVTSTSNPGTEVQLRPCSVVLKRLEVSGTSKCKETLIEKKVSQFHSVHNTSVFRHRTLHSKSSTKKKPVETSNLGEEHLTTPKRQISTELDTESRRNCVSSQPETPTIHRTNFDRKHTLVKKPSVSKSLTSRSVQCSSENILSDKATSGLSIVQSSNKKRKHSSIKQILNRNRKSLTSFQNTDRLPNRRNQFSNCTVNILVDDICLHSSSESHVEPSNNKKRKHTSAKKISKHNRKSPASFQNSKRLSNRRNLFNNSTVNIPVDDICLSSASESHVKPSNNKKRKHTSEKKISKRNRKSPASFQNTDRLSKRRNQFNNCTVNIISIDDLSRSSLSSQSDTTSQRPNPTCIKKSVRKTKITKRSTHQVEISSIQITKNSKSRPNNAQSRKKASSKCDTKIPSSIRKSSSSNRKSSSSNRKSSSSNKKSSSSNRKSSSSNKKTSSSNRKSSSSNKKFSSSNRKSSSSNRKVCKVKSRNDTESLPLDDLRLISRSPKKPNSIDFKFHKNILKRKRIAFDSLKRADELYEDDIYEFRKFDKFEQLFVDTSFSPPPSGMSTPKLGYTVTPEMNDKSPNFVDCISLANYKLYRKVAEECMLQNKTGKRVGVSSVSVSSFPDCPSC